MEVFCTNSCQKKIFGYIGHLFFIVFLLSINNSLLHAGNASFEDSLLTELDKSFGDQKAEIYTKLAKHYSNKNFEKSNFYSYKILKYAEENNSIKYRYIAYFRMGLANYFKPNNDSALIYLEKSLDLSRQEKDYTISSETILYLGYLSLRAGDKMLEALAYFRRAIHEGEKGQNYRVLGGAYSSASNLFRLTGGYEKALQYIIKAEENYKLAEFTEGEAWINYLLGLLYDNMKLYNEAVEKYSLCLLQYRKLAEADGVMSGVSLALGQLSKVHLGLGNYEIATVYNQEAMEINEQNNDMLGKALCFSNFAKIELSKGNYSQAINYSNKCRTIYKDENNTLGLAPIYIIFAKAYQGQGLTEIAYKNILQGLEFAQLNNQVSVISTLYNLAAENCYQSDKYKSAYQHLKHQLTLDDSISLTQSARNITLAQNLSLLDTKDKQISLLEKENQIKNLVIEKEIFQKQRAMLIVISLIILLIFNMILYIKKRKAMEVQRKQKEVIDNQRLELTSRNTQLFARKSDLEEMNSELHKTVHDLEKALNDVNTLSGLIPICASCKKIRDDGGYWNQLESYISEHSDVDFSHSLCPDCAVELYPELYDDDGKLINK